MWSTLLSLSTALAALATTALAHNIQMGAHSRECFHEQLHKDDKMTVTFQVGDREFGGAGNLEIDFWVSVSILCALCASGRAHIVRGVWPRGHRLHTSATRPMLIVCRPIFRSSILPARTSSTSAASPPATTASTPIKTVNLNTASATNTGQRVARRSASTYMASYTSLNMKYRTIPWRRK